MGWLSIRNLVFSVVGTGLIALGCVAQASALRLVVELRPEQQKSDLERATAELLGEQAAVAPMFTDIDADDDPYALHKLFTVDAMIDELSTSPWDMAYALRAHGNFLRVEPDLQDVLVNPTARAALCPTTSDDESTADPNWSLLSVKADKAWELAPAADGKRFGEGVRVCHLDTGWSDHEDLDAARLDLSSDYDFLDDDDDAKDPLDYHGHRGHGTSTGSVIASSGGISESGATLPPGKITGIAPKATLVPMRSVRSVVHFLDSDVAKAVRRSVDARCDVISMSLGGRAFFGLERALMDAVRNEVIPVAAAGNCIRFVVAPAMYDATVAVAATNVHETPWRGSSRGRAVDISAPGERVHVAWKKTVDDPSTTTIRSDGTSYATAYTAGAAALWIAYHGEESIRDAYGSGTRKDLFLRLLRESANTPAGWDSRNYGAGILDAAALLKTPLPRSDNAARKPVTPVPQIELLSRITEIDVKKLRSILEALWGAENFSASMDLFGPELLHIAVHQPEQLRSIFSRFGGDADSARREATPAFGRLGSKTLTESLEISEPVVLRQEVAGPAPEITQRVLLEIDRMQGTSPVETDQMIGGARVSLADMYAAAGIGLRIVEDQTDIPRARSVRLADLHALLNANRSLTPAEDEWHVYMLVVTEDRDSRDTLGIMFDYGENDANDMPRESFAVFESAHESLDGGVAREMLLTTAHELAHAFNLHHTDYDGSSFTRRSTVEGYSLSDTVRWRLSEASVEHFRSHPGRLVSPGSGNLPFGMVSQDHANRHRSSPRENYAVVADDTTDLNRRTTLEASAAVRTQLAPANDVSALSPVRLRIDTAKDVYSLGEAVSLTVAVVNTGDAPEDVVPFLSPEYGFLNILIRGPNQQEYRPYQPPVLRSGRMGSLSKTLQPRDAMLDEARIFFSSGGWTFDSPGDYEIQATFPADTSFSDDVIRSDLLRITIEPASTETAANANRLLFDKGGFGFGAEQGLYLYMGGGSHLSFGSERLRQLVREFPQAAHSDLAKVALASEALQPTMDPAGGAAAQPRIDEAQQFLRGLQDPANVPGLSLMRLQQQLIQELENDGRDAEARAFRKDFSDSLQQSKDLQIIDREFLDREFN